jgi:phosphoribosylformylglycinamidine synthase
VESPEVLKGFFTAMQALNEAGLVLAYHDRSDGGLITALVEMALAGHCGFTPYTPNSRGGTGSGRRR